MSYEGTPLMIRYAEHLSLGMILTPTSDGALLQGHPQVVRRSVAIPDNMPEELIWKFAKIVKYDAELEYMCYCNSTVSFNSANQMVPQTDREFTEPKPPTTEPLCDNCVAALFTTHYRVSKNLEFLAILRQLVERGDSRAESGYKKITRYQFEIEPPTFVLSTGSTECPGLERRFQRAQIHFAYPELKEADLDLTASDIDEFFGGCDCPVDGPIGDSGSLLNEFIR